MTLYDDAFYDVINEGSLRSARTIAPVLASLFHPVRVADVGCGEGAWLSVFAHLGCEVYGVDGPVDPARLLIPPGSFAAVDLATDAEALPGEWFDLVLCLEVAEHLPESRADWLIDTLTSHAHAVAFSAAIPGQGGAGHVNERYPAYWAAKFDQRGYDASGALRWEFWARAPHDVENWYAQNLLVCVERSELAARPELQRYLFGGPLAYPFAVVHPVLWESRL